MKKIILLCCLLTTLFLWNGAWGQISVPNTTPVTENFDSMGSTNNLPSNWRLNGTATPTFSGGSTTTTQNACGGTPTTGGTYNWGISAACTDRAVGSMTSGSFSSPRSLMSHYRNTHPTDLISSVSVSYEAERYRINTAVASIEFYYSLDGNNWTAIVAGDIASGNFPTGSSSYTFTTPLVVSRTGIVITFPTALSPSSDFYLRWNINTTGSNSQGIGIDNVSVTATFIPPSFTGPEINVRGNSVSIVNGDMTPSLTDHTDFGGVNVTAGTQNRTFTIENLGTSDLNIGTITITGAHASDFTILSLPSSTIPAASTSTLVIQFDPSALGLRTAQVNIPNNDSDENPYTFAIQGLGSNQTTLRPGDMMFIGFDNQISGPTDKISIVTLVDISPSTKFIYANAVYEMLAPANVRTRRWYACDGTPSNNIEAFEITYNGTTTIGRGSIICFEVPGTGGPDNFSINGVASSDFSRVNAPNTTGTGGTNMSTTAPDAVFLMQGTFINHGTYSTFEGNILGGIMQGGTWWTVADDLTALGTANQRRRSRIPPEIECFAIQATTSIDRSVAYYTGPRGSNPQFTHINNIINFTGNWFSDLGTTGDDFPATQCNSAFTVTGAAAVPGKWTGTTNTNWFNCRNWENFSVPTATVDVTISPTATNNPTISSTAINADLYFASLDGTQRVAECRNINLDRLTLIIEGNNTPPNRLDIHGNLNISGTGALDMDDSNSATPDGVINLLGNWENTLGTASSFQEGNGTIRFREGLNQTITTQGGTERFYNIVFNKTAGNVTLNSTNVEISGSATFTAGRVNAPNATTARMEFLDNATTTGANNNSYVNGWVRKVGNDTFVFPVGDDGFYAPIAISAPSAATDHFTATYDRIYPNPYDITSKDVTLDHVGNCEHWILNRTGGTSNVFVELSYDNVRSCGITSGQESALRVARWDGAVWRDHGNTTATLIPASAIRSSAAISSFSPFTLASSNSFNPLPLELLSFKGKINEKGESELTWQTATELNIAGFEVEKSTDNREFRKIGFVNAKNSHLNTYGFLDKDFTGLSYYRLRVLEQDKTFRYSPTISLDKTKAVQLLIYPNPATEKDFVKVALGTRSEISTIKVEIVSQTGKTLAVVNDSLVNTETQLSEKLQNLPKGLYIIRLQTENGEMLTSKFIKQ